MRRPSRWYCKECKGCGLLVHLAALKPRLPPITEVRCMVYKRGREEIYAPEWVVEGVLAQSQRPGYPVDRPSRNKVQEWADAVLGMGIKSVLCILDYTQLAHYDRMNLRGGGLLGYYRSLGLKVEHVYAEDHKIPPLSVEELAAVWGAFQKLEKPVLVHCSAGRDRTGTAIVFILSQLPVDGVSPRSYPSASSG